MRSIGKSVRSVRSVCLKIIREIREIRVQKNISCALKIFVKFVRFVFKKIS